MDPDTATTVRALLAAAGIEPPEDEIDAMVRAYPDLRDAARSLYTEEALRHLPAFFPTDVDLEER